MARSRLRPPHGSSVSNYRHVTDPRARSLGYNICLCCNPDAKKDLHRAIRRDARTVIRRELASL